MAIRLAIVDDHPLVREGLASLLTANPSTANPSTDSDSRDSDSSANNSTANNVTAHEVEVTYAGEDLVQALATTPHVVLLDVDLGPGTRPVAEAVALCTGGGVGVVLISAHASASTVLAGLRAGAAGFVPKRAPTQDVVAAVQDAALGLIHLTPDLATMLADDVERPALSPQELAALRLYASGLKLSAVSRRMGVSPHTVKEYLDRVRSKYDAAGRPARTRTELFWAAQRDGLIDPDALADDDPTSHPGGHA